MGGVTYWVGGAGGKALKKGAAKKVVMGTVLPLADAAKSASKSLVGAATSTVVAAAVASSASSVAKVVASAASSSSVEGEKVASSSSSSVLDEVVAPSSSASSAPSPVPAGEWDEAATPMVDPPVVLAPPVVRDEL